MHRVQGDAQWCRRTTPGALLDEAQKHCLHVGVGDDRMIAAGQVLEEPGPGPRLGLLEIHALLADGEQELDN